ncbi:MAG TPA: hypothetical protein VEA44_10590 [Caulobacter sp.]|nr:hypothetical protein [Caulobacter sp.]
MPRLTDLIPAPYRWLAWLAGAVLLIIVIMVIGSRFGGWLSDPFGIGAANRAQDRADARAAPHAKAASDAAAQAAGEQAARELESRTTEQENRNAILNAPNAGDGAGAAGAIGLERLCRRASYRNHPDCAGLRRPDPAPAPR